MKPIDLIKKTNGILQDTTVEIPSSFHRIVTDTREIEKNDIFVALKGTNFDGHNYIKEAENKGACMIFVEEKVEPLKIPIVKVKDTYQTLFDLASYYLEQHSTFTVAITGSVGKTTTKELISSILSKKYQVLKSKGNKNNRIGIPQTIFELNKKTDCLVVELGMNHRHEIDQLSNLVKPNIAVITNIGTAHIGYLKSLHNIYKAKMEIISGMKGGMLIINGHDTRLNKIKKINCGNIKKVYRNKGNIQIELIEQSVFGSKLSITNGINKKQIFFKVPGEANLENLALSLSVGELLDVPFEQMVEAVEEYEPLKQRLSVKSLPNGSILINDSYNASYESIKMDLDLLKQTKEHKIIILADILEVGKKSKSIHQKVGMDIKKIENAEFYFIGEEMKYAFKKCKKGMHFKTNQEWISHWQNQKKSNEHGIILLKGSRKMELETLIPYIYENNSVE